jgi:hypothetical protein
MVVRWGGGWMVRRAVSCCRRLVDVKCEGRGEWGALLVCLLAIGGVRSMAVWSRS